MKRRQLTGWRLVAVRAWLPVLLVIVWWVTSGASAHPYFPSLQAILQNLTQEWILGPRWRTDLLPSLTNFGLGFGLAIVLGTTLGTLLGRSPVAYVLCAPILHFFRTLPKPALIPIVLAIFGIGASMNIALIVIGALWPTLLNTIDGVRSLDLQQREMARSYQLTRWQTVRFVVLPNAGPQIFSGYRVSLQVAIILIVVSEMVGATRGLGYYVLEAQQLFRIVETWVATILIGVLGYLLTLLFLSVEKRVLAWQYSMREAMGV